MNPMKSSSLSQHTASALAALSLAAAGLSSAQYLDNQTQYSNQDPNTETRRSDHFRICFGHYNRDTGTPMTEQLAQGNLQMFEQAWNRWVVEMGMHDLNESFTNPDGNKYRANFNVLMTWDDGGGGGAYASMDAGGFGYAMANTGLIRYDPPSGATPHEFAHAWQITAGGFNGTDSSGSWWEGHANWMQLQFLNSYPHAGGYIYNGMYYPSHGRCYYDSFMIWEAAREDSRYGAQWVNEIWTNATPAQQTGEYVIDRMIRLDSSGSPDKAGAINDLWGNMAKRMITWDYERQQWLAQANKADDGSDWEFYQRCRTPLVQVPGTTGTNWYRPSRGHLPMQFGFNFIPLQAAAGTTVSCDFAPHSDPVRQSDWRACLVAVDTAGGASYSSLWNSGTNSITLSADQTRLYLMVIATPKPMKITEPVWQAYLSDAGLQFPYAVSFTNATPKNVIYPVQSRSGMVQHANGGGWKSTTATVDASAYIGPNAQVLNTAQVRGNARVEDYAVVRNNARVRDNAVVSGHAEVKDNAQVYGNAKVRDWGRVFGYAEVYENARVIEHGNCGDGNAATHTKVYGNAIVKGTTYVYNTTTINGCLIMDGDSANGNGTAPASKGVHFGWSWGADAGRFNGLADNKFLFARHSFERDNAVFAMDEFGINHGFLLNGCKTGKDTGSSVRGGRVLPLNGTNQAVELHNGVNDLKEGTFALWFKRSGTTPDQRLWSMGDGASKVMVLTPNAAGSGALRFVITDGTTTHTLDGPVIPVDVWKHVAVVFAGTTCTLYLDGLPVASNPAVTLFPDSLNAPLMENANFLGRGTSGGYFQGALDDFRCYMRSLSDAEVLALFNEAAPAPVTIAADTSAPTPNAATWLVAPLSNGDNSATMSATPGTDASGWVEYYFTCVSGGGHDSGWVSFNKYTDVGLSPGSAPTYTVRMRDRNGNTTAESAPASVTLATSSAGGASFSYGPVGIANGQITMTATQAANASGKVEYKFDRTLPTAASSGWRSSATWTQSGLTTGTSYTYTVTVRDGRGNTSAPSAPATAIARDDAAPRLPIAAAHWQMLPYATIDNKVSMTAQAATDPSGLEYQFNCVSGGGPNSAWQASPTFVTTALADGTYVYQYKVRDKSARNNESPYSTSYPAKITQTTGYHTYTLEQVLAGTDDWLVSFPGTVMKVNSDHYMVRNLATGNTVKVKPDTYALVTDPTLALKNVTVKGHLYTLGGERVVTYSNLTSTGNPTLYTISGRVTNASGTGIAGATVCFSDVANAPVSPVITATTDASGNFSKGVTTGTWYVAVTSGAHNTSADQTVSVNTSNVSGVNFTLVANASVTGTIVRASDGTPLAGASVYFSMSPGASSAAVFTATADANGNYSQAVQDGVWYVAAGATGNYTSSDKMITVNGSAVGGIGFALKSNARNIPQTSDLLFSVVTDSLPASGATGNWATYLPSGQNLTSIGSPTVLTSNGVKWASHSYADGDGFRQGQYTAPIPINGATIIVAAKPQRNTTGTSWTSLVDIFYQRLVLGIKNSTGQIQVWRNNSLQTGSAIPDGQTTVLTLVVQPTGQYKVFANGVQVMNITSTSDMTSLNPDMSTNGAGWSSDAAYTHYINVGRNEPDGWTTFNGGIGDVFVYKTALDDAARQQLEADMAAKFISTDHTITATAGTGGSINPSGAVPVVPGGSQTFTIAPLAGYLISQVTVDGVPQGAVGSYTFSNVAANRTIGAVFVAGTNTPPTISTIAPQMIAANTNTGALAFTVADAETPAGSLTLAGSSNNTALVPASNIVFGGSGANRTVTVTPAPSMIGSATITLTVSDGTATGTSSFVLNVTTPPGAPSISAIADQTTDEDQPTAAIPFTLADSDTPAASLTVVGSSSNPALVPDSNIVFGGSGENRTVTLTPLPNQSGTCVITLTVSDGSFPVSTAFQLTVIPINDPPTITNVADLSITQDSATPPIAVVIGDLETDAAALTLTAASSNPGLVPETNIAISGSGANRTVVITPAAGLSGAAAITLTVSDGVATASVTFTLTVTPAVNATTISINVGANGVIGTADIAGVVPVSRWNNLTGTSNPVAAAGSLVDSTGASVAGISASFQGSQNTFNAGSSPNTNLLSGFLSGTPMSATVSGIPYAKYDVYVYYNGFVSNHSMTWRLSNVTGSPVVLSTQYAVRGSVSSGNLFSSSGNSHVLSQYGTLADADAAAAAGTGGTYLKFSGVTASAIKIEEISNNGGNENGFTAIQIVNASAGTAPVVSVIADQIINENTSTTAIPFTVSDDETAADSLVITAGSSNTTLVPETNIVLGGSGGNRTVTVTPASGQNGSAIISLSVSDGTFTTVESFALTVSQGTAVVLTRHSGTSATSTYGDSLSFEVTVTGAPAPTGTVTLKDGGTGGTTLGSATLSGGVCTITPTANALAVGSHDNIVAVYSGDSNHPSSASVALDEQMVNPKSFTVTGTSVAAKEYDGTTAATLTGSPVLAGVLAGDVVTLANASTGSFSDKNAGTGKAVTTAMTISGTAASNYSLSQPSLTGNIAALPITVAAVNATKTYDGTTVASGIPAVTPSLSADDTATLLSQSYQNPDAGNGNKVIVPVIAINDGNGGENYAVTYLNYLTGTILPAPATVTLSDLEHTYDGTPKSATAITSPIPLAVAFTYDGLESNPVNAGSYVVFAVVSDPNYQGSTSGTLVILDQPYKTWQAEHFTPEQINAGLADENEDPDRDGKTNFYEFAFHGDPLSGADPPTFLAHVRDGADDDTTPELAFTCAIRRGAVFSPNGSNAQASLTIDGVVYVIEATRLLAGPWNGVVTDEGASDTGPPGSGLPYLTGTDWEYRTFSAFNGLTGSGFMRARVSRP